MVLGSVSTFVTIDYVDELTIGQFSNASNHLHDVLGYCAEKKIGNDVNLIMLHYYNDTHSIDSNSCKWAIVEKGYANVPIFEINRNELQQVLDWCNDPSGVKYGFYNYSNETHSINTSICKWKEHVTYPTGGGLCVPYVEKWIGEEDWSNKTHYFDTNSCVWKVDPEFDSLNSKGCPQFCPKEDGNQFELQKILDYCSNGGEDEFLQYENKTHIITSDNCEWRKMHVRGNAGN